MTLVIRQLEEDDFSSMFDIFAAAFAQEPTMALMFDTNVAGAKAWFIQTNQQMFYNDPAAQFYKVVDTTTGAMTTYARWTTPCISKSDAGSAPTLPQSPEGVNMRLMQEVYGEKFKTYDRCGYKSNSWFALESMCTHPKYQGKGASSQMLAHLLSEADAQKAPIVLGTSQSAYDMYKRHGFVEMDEFTVDLSQHGGSSVARIPCMVRQPKTTTV